MDLQLGAIDAGAELTRLGASVPGAELLGSKRTWTMTQQEAPWMIKCLEYIMKSLFVTVDAPKTRETHAIFFP